MLLTVSAADAATAHGVSKMTFARWCKAGLIPGARKDGSRWVVPISEITTDERPPRSPLRYPGGKTRAVKTLLPMIPAGRRLVSPFAGGCSLEIAVADRGQDVVAYDAFRPLVRFWQHALEDPKPLAAFARRRMKMSKPAFYRLQQRMPTMDDPFHQAAAFFVLNRSSFSGSTMSGGMSPTRDRFTPSSVDRLRTFRCPRLWVAHRTFDQSIPAHPDDFLYVDPPYALESGSRLYGVQGDMHAGFDHEALAALLLPRGGWLLSYNDCDRIRRLYAGCRIEPAEWSYGMSKDKRSSEIVIRPKGEA